MKKPLKIGILFMAYNNALTFEKSLSQLIHAKDKKLGGHEFIISAVSLPFEEYKDVTGFKEDNDTYRMLESLITCEKINYLTTNPKFIKEHEARTAGIGPLMIDKCNLIINIDGDEWIDLKEFEKALEFIEENPLTPWFKWCYKNYVFDHKHYLAEPFSPPRIWRTKINDFIFAGFSWDNDAKWFWEKQKTTLMQNSQSFLTIPKNIFWAKHFTWLDDENSRNKIAYQNLHFKGTCSYAVENDKLVFNKDYYNKIGQPLPEVIKE